MPPSFLELQSYLTERARFHSHSFVGLFHHIKKTHKKISLTFADGVGHKERVTFNKL